MRWTVGLIAVLAALACGAPSAVAAPKHARTRAEAAPAAATEQVALKEEGGALLVPVTINDSVKLDFMLDSGAAVVSIPADVAMTLIRTGTLTRDDFLGRERFRVADGRSVPATILRIKSLKVGGIVVHDVQASVSDSKGPLLLGQTFLARLTTWSIDNARHVLVLGPERPGGPPPLQIEPVRRARRSAKRTEQDAPASHALAPADKDGEAGAGSGRPETAKGAAWDAAFYQSCLSHEAPSAGGSRAGQTFCRCVGDALQPLPLSRKKRLVPHSHEILAAEAQCAR